MAAVAPPTSDAVVPAPNSGFVQVKGSQSLLIGWKAWGMGYSLADNGVEKESRGGNRDLLNMQVT
jgi:hypothetical protein